ncbi:PD-(D/E)XK nuclease family transposase [Beggiatoa leptomitoformis]|uniref:Rpn family recombination-promoting nuclease/putative transposase n=1 Tax=Beggiatoa leptomitoformis TaxID=288004 RepID=A0A2N9YED4_9GAMM|nr:PD-(D/E)XK nuclease family transposase [Beggiatoa leptomitoformis]ALG68791.1 hypothetical protein AL038_15165 [Beggiatoa leptomitoformis]AUI68847.1 hypothetical protein BLE401_09090 [Beggiatoa leptomitoformis]
MIEVAPLKFGVVFKHAFSQVTVFKNFVKDVIDIDINIDKVHTEYEYPTQIGFVKSKYDLFAEDVEKRIIVEIQHIKEEDFFDRFLYYHLISLVEQIGTYQKYQFEKTVYTIVVLTSLPRDKSVQFSCAVSDMSPIDEHGKKHNIYPHRLIFLCPRLVNEDTPVNVKTWLELIEDSLDGKLEEDKFTAQKFKDILNAIHQQRIDPALLAQIKDEAAWEDVKREERKEGFEAGVQLGLQQGLQEGEKRGEKQGERRKALETAQKMLSKGFSLKEVVELTGLSETDLKES